MKAISTCIWQALALLMLCATPLFAQESDEIKLKCVQDGAVVFTSIVADIGAFDAAAHGVSLTNTMPSQAGNATLYIFNAGVVMCAVSHQ